MGYLVREGSLLHISLGALLHLDPECMQIQAAFVALVKDRFNGV